MRSDITLWGMCARFPEAPLLAVGFSMGGLILTKFLGELGMGRWEAATGACACTRYVPHHCIMQLLPPCAALPCCVTPRGTA